MKKLINQLVNPFIPHTTSHRLFEALRSPINGSGRTAKYYFNVSGMDYNNADQANAILKNMAYLLKNISHKDKEIKLNHKIALRKPGEIDPELYKRQIEITATFEEGMRLLREAQEMHCAKETHL